MNCIRVFAFSLVIPAMTGCSSVRVAVYDSTSRQDYAMETKAAYTKSPAYKERTIKAALTQSAEEYIGTPYRYGSCDARKGFDCSGLVYTVAKSQNLTLPRSSSLMASSGNHIPWKKAEKGDLIFFGERSKIDHVGIIEANRGNQMWVIHSTTSSGVVKEDVLASTYWRKRILFAMNIVPPVQGKS